MILARNGVEISAKSVVSTKVNLTCNTCKQYPARGRMFPVDSQKVENTRSASKRDFAKLHAAWTNTNDTVQKTRAIACGSEEIQQACGRAVRRWRLNAPRCEGVENRWWMRLWCHQRSPPHHSPPPPTPNPRHIERECRAFYGIDYSRVDAFHHLSWWWSWARRLRWTKRGYPTRHSASPPNLR